MYRLKDFKVVAFDFDNTLIDHPLSSQMWEYIIRNPYGQEFHLVTFRSGGYQDFIGHDLQIRGSDLTLDHFAALHAIDHAMWVTHKANNGEVIIDDPYQLWKGQRCSEIGAEVLIDDDTENVQPGCARYGIVLFHPDELV